MIRYQNVTIIQFLLIIQPLTLKAMQQESLVKILNRDGQALEMDTECVRNCRTISNMMSDAPDQENAIAEHTGKDHRLFNMYLPRAREIAAKKKKGNPLAQETDENLITIATSADYFEAPKILQKSTSILADRLANNEKHKKYFRRYGKFPLFNLIDQVAATIVERFVKKNSYIKTVMLEDQKLLSGQQKLPTRIEGDYDVYPSDKGNDFKEEGFKFLNQPWRLLVKEQDLYLQHRQTKQTVPLSDNTLGELTGITVAAEKVYTVHGPQPSSDGEYALVIWDKKTGEQLQKWKYPRRILVEDFIDDLIIARLEHPQTLIGRFAAIFQRGKPHGLLYTPHVQGIPIPSIAALHNNGKMAISGSFSGEVSVCDTQNGAPYARFEEGHIGRVTAVTCHPKKEDLFASGGTDADVRLWSLDKALAVLKGHTAQVNSVAFSNAGDMLASGSRDMSVRLWSVPLQTCLQVITEHLKPIYKVFFSPDDIVLVSKAEEFELGITTLFNKDTQKAIARLSLDQAGLLAHTGQQIVEGKQIAIRDKEQFRQLYKDLPTNLQNVLQNHMSWSDWSAIKYEDLKERIAL